MDVKVNSVPQSDWQPIYIGGPDRCGKTTLQAFLTSHPNISIPAVGSNLWSYFYGQYGDLRQPDNFERCLDALLHYKHALFLQPDPNRLRWEFWQGAPSYARLFGLLHQHYAERTGKPRWGDQTGLIERYADEILEASPRARILHMLRDPRDRYEASLAMWPDGKGRCGAATARWKYSADLAQRNLERYPDRYRIIRFETLIHRPEETLQEICDFLGETYTPAMLTMEGSPGHREKLRQGGATEGIPLSTSFIGRYRSVISKPEVAFIQEFSRRQMTAFGYELDPVHFSTSEAFAYATQTRAVNFVRMVAWLTMEQFQQRYPAFFGRRPSNAMMISKTGPGYPASTVRPEEP
ncbi:MAG TPA: sulfotransferase [Anaerolineaceae bacterium]|nr:sulfotransferase [Anaerolineaceae bacterium]